MRDNTFRNLVKSEVQFWLEANAKPLRGLLDVLAAQLAPLMAAEIERGLAKRFGQLEPDERDKAADLIERLCGAVEKFTSRGKEFDEWTDDLVRHAQGFAVVLRAQIHPNRRLEPGSEPKKEEF